MSKIEEKEKNNAFNRLYNLQMLLKKESALKELCNIINYLWIYHLVINTREETNKQINKECADIYKEKIELYNKVLEHMDIQYKSNNFLHEQKLKLLNPDSKPNEDNNIKYELIDDLSKSEILDDLNVYLPLFMETLWKQPNIVSKILLNANNKDMSEHLSYFFCHNFYENILSPNYKKTK